MRIGLGADSSFEFSFSWPPHFGFESWATRQVRSWYLGLGLFEIRYYGGWVPVSRRGART